MATAVAPGVMQLLPISKIRPKDNVRLKLGDLTELTASIKSYGVLQPVTVTPNGSGWILIFGHRRHAAAAAAGLKEIPAIVREDLVDGDRVAAQLIENLMRVDLDPLEESAGYGRLVELGLKQSEIAKKVGRSEAHISKRLALTGLSPLTAKLLAAGTIPIESAIGLAKYKHEYQDRAIEHVKKMYRNLEEAAPYQLRNLGDRARDEAKKVARSNQRRELTKKLKADGVTILSAQQSYNWGQPGQPWRLGKPVKDSYRSESRVDMTPKQHSEFPCHSAAVTSPGSIYDTAEPKVVYLCSDPTSHMDADEKAKYKKKISDSKRDPYEERQRAEKVVQADLAEAQASRLPAIQDQLKAFDRPTLLKLALEFVVIGADKATLARLLGIEVSKGKNQWDAVATFCNASEANLVRAAAAVAIDDGQGAIAELARAQAGNFYFNREDLPHAVAAGEWFKQVGIALTELENKALEKATKK